MKHLIFFIAILFLIPATPADAASGGGSSGASAPQQQRVKLTPEQKAAARYNDGLAHRDRAAKHELRAVDEKREKQSAKLQKKIAKEYDKAIRDYEKSVKFSSTYYEVHGSLGYALRKVGRYEESLAAYNESLRINPAYGNAIEYRGEAYLGLNRIDDAKQAYMSLFRSDAALAAQLLAAMNDWVAMRRADSGDLASETVEQFASWVSQRRELASFMHRIDGESTELWAESS